MIRLVVACGALLIAAPLFSQKPAPQVTEKQGVPNYLAAGQTEWLKFQLNETPQQVADVLGAPASIEPFGDFEAWRYQLGVEDHHDFSHELVFRISTGRLISVTRNFEPERLVDELFPANETTVEHYPSKDRSEYSARMRRLDGDRLLLAMGSGKAGQSTGKLLLIRVSEAPNFIDWVKLGE